MIFACPPMLLILGPMRLAGAAGSVELGGVKPRMLLAALALHAGEVVSAERLADVTWGEDLPSSARQNIHTYVWSLRRALSTAGCRSAILARPPGYLLEVASGELDWQVFLEMSAAAAGCAAARPAKAADLLREALGLWHGPVLADIADAMPSLRARITAMEEARMAALERRVSADLAAGRHRELAGELAELVIAHPLREQFRAQQMLTLYRCGRQAEAFTAFHQLRSELAVELGIGPGPEIRRLYEAMLQADRSLVPGGPGHDERSGAADGGSLVRALNQGRAGNVLRIAGGGPRTRQITGPELARCVKAALNDIYMLDRLQESPLAVLPQIRESPDPGVELRNRLLRAVGTLRTSALLPERQAGAVLDQYYLRRSGSMELVAKKLELTRTTCHRRLRQGLARVSALLANEENAAMP